jgi:hypothetical protein
MTFGSLSLLELSGPVQASAGISLAFSYNILFVIATKLKLKAP